MSILLDCTLRDGGYYTDWTFSDQLVHKYLSCMAAAGVDYVEVGLRRPFSTIQDPMMGFYADIDDAQIRSLCGLNWNGKLKFAVMVNAKEFDQYSPAAQIDQIFEPRDQSPVSLVRIATTDGEMKRSRKMAQRLKDLGYLVALNLMRFTIITPPHLEDLIRDVATWGTVDVFYLADSLGGMFPAFVNDALHVVRREWSGDIGVHMHDNYACANANTDAAAGEARWLDGTMLGMGRGAGNARTEILLQHMAPAHPRMSVLPLLELYDDFAALQAKYHWGPNPYYAMSAKLQVHPTYVQELIARKTRPEIIVAILNLLTARAGHTYDATRLRDLLDTCTQLASVK